MAITTLLAAGSGSIAASTSNSIQMGYGGYVIAATDAVSQVPYREAGTLSGLYCNIATNSRGASTFVSRIGGSAGNQTVSIGSSATGEFEDTTHSDTISAGNLVNGLFTTGSGGTTFNPVSTRYLYAVSAGPVMRMIAFNTTAGSSATSATYYFPIAGIFSVSQPNTTEANVQLISRSSGTLANMFWRVGANARADTSQNLKSRINTADGNLVINSQASTTGTFEDTTHTDSISSGNKINYSLTLGGTASNFNVTSLGCSFTNTGNDVPAFNGQGRNNAGTPTGSIFNANATYYPSFSSNNQAGPDTTEALDQQKSGIAFTGSRMQAIVGTNGVSASSTWRFRISAGNGNQVVTIASATTGANEDTTHTDSVVATDEVNYSLATGATGTNLTVIAQGQMITLPTTATGLFGLSFLDGLSTSGPTQFTRVA